MRFLRLPNVVTNADTPTAIFGGWDGCVSVLAAVLAVAVATHGHGAQAAGIGGAIGGVFSMGTGQYISDGGMTRGKRLRRATIMGGGTAAGGFLPVIPFLVPGTSYVLASSMACVLALGLASLVAVVNVTLVTPDTAPTWTELWGSLAVTWGLLAATAAATFAIGLAYS